MTYLQQKRHEKLRDNVMKAYNAWDKNIDKSKDEQLFNALEKARLKCEEFEDKYL